MYLCIAVARFHDVFAMQGPSSIRGSVGCFPSAMAVGEPLGATLDGVVTDGSDAAAAGAVSGSSSLCGLHPRCWLRYDFGAIAAS